MDIREIAKGSAVAYLSHAHFTATSRSVPTVEYEDAGERVGGFRSSILEVLQKEISDSSESVN